MLHREAPRLPRFPVGSAGAHHREAGDGSEAGQLFHGLMRGAIFADADAVMREHPKPDFSSWLEVPRVLESDAFM